MSVEVDGAEGVHGAIGVEGPRERGVVTASTMSA